MNSLFKKVATSLSLLALLFGIGLTGRGIHSVKAIESGPDASTGLYSDAFETGVYTGSGETGVITWTLETPITLVQHKGTSSNDVVSSYNESMRIYVGHYLHFKALNGYIVKKVEINYTTNYFGGSITAGISFAEDGKVVDDTTKITKTIDTSTRGGTHTFTIVENISEFYIHNTATKQIRCNKNGIKVYYEKPAPYGEVTTVTVKAPGDITGEYTVSTGYIGRKTFKLTADVVQTGNLTTMVTWESEDVTTMTIRDDGLVKVLKSSPSGVTITATSKADTSKTGSIIIKTSISTFPGVSEFTMFDTATYGASDKIVSTKGSNVDLTGPLQHVTLNVTMGGSSNKPGFYNADAILKAYTDDELTFTSQEYKISWIDFETISGYPLTASTATVSAGEFLSHEDNKSTLDLYGVEATSVKITLKAQVRINKITLGVLPRTVSKLEIDTTEAGDLSFAKDSSFTSETALANKIKAIVTFDDNTTLDVTEMAVWSLDTSAVGTASLTVMYKGITSSPVSVNIVASTIAVTSITITPNTGLEVYSGQTIQFSVDVLPSNATEKGVIWSVSPSNYGSITEDGLFTAGGATNEGTVTVTATAKDGSGVSNSVTVTFSEYPYQVASSVNGGDQVIFINDNQNKYLSSMSETTSPKFAIASDCVDTFALPTYVFTLVAGTQDGSFAFKHGDKYLNWTKDNSLEQVDTITNNSSWTISIDADRLATITNVADTTRLIKYNGDRFATYVQNTTAPKLRLLKLKGESGEGDALVFGARFLNGFSAICTQNNTTDTAMLKEKWYQLVSVYTSLSSEAKAYIAMKQADETSTNNVEKMLALYNYIYHKYGTSLSLTNW